MEICLKNQVHKLGVKICEIIGLKKLLKNVWTIWLKKLVGIIGLRNLVGKAYSV